MSVTDDASLLTTDSDGLSVDRPGTGELDLDQLASAEPEPTSAELIAIPERLLFGEYGGVIIVSTLLAAILIACMMLPQ